MDVHDAKAEALGATFETWLSSNSYNSDQLRVLHLMRENIQANAADLTVFDSWRFDHAPLSHHGGFERARIAFVVFTRGGRTERVMFLHADFDGFKLDANHDQPTETDDFPDLIAAFRSGHKRCRDWRLRDPAAPWTKKWWFADADAIEREDWNLFPAHYRPESRNSGVACAKSETIPDGILHLRPFSVTEDGRLVIEGAPCIPPSLVPASKQNFESGDILFKSTNSMEIVGKSTLVRTPLRAAFSNHMTRIRVNPTMAEPGYIHHFLCHLYARRVFQQRATRWVS